MNNNKKDISKKLFNLKKDSIDSNPDNIEIYKLYVEMADRISSRRQSANSFFLSINTALISGMSYIFTSLYKKIAIINLSLTLVFMAIVGIILCYIWSKLILSYKQLNSGKFKVIHLIETKLPMSPYDAEWFSLGEGKNKSLYFPFTEVEGKIPYLFGSIYIISSIILLCWLCHCIKC